MTPSRWGRARQRISRTAPHCSLPPQCPRTWRDHPRSPWSGRRNCMPAQSISDPGERSLALQRTANAAIFGNQLTISRTGAGRGRTGIAPGAGPADPRPAADRDHHLDEQPGRSLPPRGQGGPDAVRGRGRPNRGRRDPQRRSPEADSPGGGCVAHAPPTSPGGSSIRPIASRCSIAWWTTRPTAARRSSTSSRVAATRCTRARMPRPGPSSPPPTESWSTRRRPPPGSSGRSGATGRWSRSRQPRRLRSSSRAPCKSRG